MLTNSIPRHTTIREATPAYGPDPRTCPRECRRVAQLERQVAQLRRQVAEITELSRQLTHRVAIDLSEGQDDDLAFLQQRFAQVGRPTIN